MRIAKVIKIYAPPKVPFGVNLGGLTKSPKRSGFRLNPYATGGLIIGIVWTVFAWWWIVRAALWVVS